MLCFDGSLTGDLNEEEEEEPEVITVADEEEFPSCDMGHPAEVSEVSAPAVVNCGNFDFDIDMDDVDFFNVSIIPATPPSKIVPEVPHPYIHCLFNYSFVLVHF